MMPIFMIGSDYLALAANNFHCKLEHGDFYSNECQVYHIRF